MNHSHYLCTSNDGLYVYIPVRFYEVTLKHRLLEKLGGFSHLLLDALAQLPERGIDWVLNVTGLSQQQLQPILKRLQGLGLLNGSQLSQQGKNLSIWKKLLHGQTRHIWLDGYHKSHTFFGNIFLNVVELDEDNSFIIRRWHRGNDKPRSWSCGDWNEDCERQRNRILHHPDQYLVGVFENFRECFINTGFKAHEWELNVRYVTQMTGLALEVEVDPASLRSGAEGGYLVTSPVLCLDTRYSPPEGMLLELRNLQPKDQHRSVSFGRVVPDSLKLYDKPPSSWVWPITDQRDREYAVNLLFQKVASTDSPTEMIFNREHTLADRWQCYELDWSIIESSLEEIEGLYRIRREV